MFSHPPGCVCVYVSYPRILRVCVCLCIVCANVVYVYTLSPAEHVLEPTCVCMCVCMHDTLKYCVCVRVYVSCVLMYFMCIHVRQQNMFSNPPLQRAQRRLAMGVAQTLQPVPGETKKDSRIK